MIKKLCLNVLLITLSAPCMATEYDIFQHRLATEGQGYLNELKYSSFSASCSFAPDLSLNTKTLSAYSSCDTQKPASPTSVTEHRSVSPLVAKILYEADPAELRIINQFGDDGVHNMQKYDESMYNKWNDLFHLALTNEDQAVLKIFFYCEHESLLIQAIFQSEIFFPRLGLKEYNMAKIKGILQKKWPFVFEPGPVHGHKSGSGSNTIVRTTFIVKYNNGVLDEDGEIKPEFYRKR